MKIYPCQSLTLFVTFLKKKNPSNYLIDLEAFANSFNKRVDYVNTKI